MDKKTFEKAMDLAISQHHEIARLRRIEDAALLIVAHNRHLCEGTLKPLLDALEHPNGDWSMPDCYKPGGWLRPTKAQV